jgi:hypothetical protein
LRRTDFQNALSPLFGDNLEKNNGYGPNFIANTFGPGAVNPICGITWIENGRHGRALVSAVQDHVRCMPIGHRAQVGQFSTSAPRSRVAARSRAAGARVSAHQRRKARVKTLASDSRGAIDNKPYGSGCSLNPLQSGGLGWCLTVTQPPGRETVRVSYPGT